MEEKPTPTHRHKFNGRLVHYVGTRTPHLVGGQEHLAPPLPVIVVSYIDNGEESTFTETTFDWLFEEEPAGDRGPEAAGD